MKPKSLLIGAFLVALVVLGLGFGAALLSRYRPVEVGLDGDRLRACPQSPNCVCSEYEDVAAYIEPLTFACEPQPALRSLVDFLEAEPNAEVLEWNERYVHAVYTTRFLKFADDVEFRADPLQRVIQVRSASRIGHSDFGANRDRIEDLRRRWVPPDR